MSTTAVPSKLPEDFALNIENLDKFSNSTSPTFIDRLGVEKITIAGATAQVNADVATVEAAKNTAIITSIPAAVALVDTAVAATAAGQATVAKVAAELARDAAQLSAGIYATTAAGLAATTTGKYFSVPSADSAEYLILYLNNAGVAVEQKRYPSAAAIKVTQKAGSLAAVVIADVNDKALGWWDTAGGLNLIDLPVTVQAKLTSLEAKVPGVIAGSSASIVFADSNDKTLAYIDGKAGLRLAGMSRSVQDSVASNDLFTAKQYELRGDAINAAYWYDRAKNAFIAPVRMDALVALNNTDDAIQRVPAVTKVGPSRLLCVFQQIKRPVGSDGDGVRLARSFIDYNTDTGAMTVSARVVLDEPAGWATNQGASLHPALLTLPSGRVLCVFNVIESPDGKVANAASKYHVYQMASDDNGVTWSARTKIIDASILGGTNKYVCLGSGGDFLQIPEGAYAGRLIVPFYSGTATAETGKGAIYSDDNGLTWGISGVVATPTYETNENAVAWNADGTLTMSIRSEYNKFVNVRATSSDGGLTWVFDAGYPGWVASNCARSMAQGAPRASDGFSKLLWSGLSNASNYSRSGLKIRVSHDKGKSYQCEYSPITQDSGAGYSNIKLIGPDLFAVVYEDGFNANSSIRLFILNTSELYKNGINY